MSTQETLARIAWKRLTRRKPSPSLLAIGVLSIVAFVLWRRWRKNGSGSTIAKPALELSVPQATLIPDDGEGNAPSPEHLLLPSMLGSFEPPSLDRLASDVASLSMRVGALETCGTQPMTSLKVEKQNGKFKH